MTDSLENHAKLVKQLEYTSRLRKQIATLQDEVARLKDEIRYRDGMKALENQAQPTEKD